MHKEKNYTVKSVKKHNKCAHVCVPVFILNALVLILVCFLLSFVCLWLVTFVKKKKRQCGGIPTSAAAKDICLCNIAICSSGQRRRKGQTHQGKQSVALSQSHQPFGWKYLLAVCVHFTASEVPTAHIRCGDWFASVHCYRWCHLSLDLFFFF